MIRLKILVNYLINKLKRMKNQGSTNNVTSSVDIKVEEFYNSLKDIEDQFKKFQFKVTEDVANLK